MAKVGMKFDDDKPRMELVPLEAVEFVAAVLTYGAQKYEDGDWKRVPNAVKRYRGAALRHLAKDQAGEKLDPESGLPHLAQAATNILFELWLRRDEFPRTYDFSNVRKKWARRRAAERRKRRR